MDGGLEARRGAYTAAAVVVVGLAWRVSSLGPSSLYRDDTWQSLATRASPISDTLLTGGIAPGYAAFLRAWSTLAGRSALALQVPAVIAGVLAPVLVYLLARRFRLQPAAAVVAGVFMFTSDVLLQMSVRVKPFALDALVTMAVLALGIRATEAADEDRRWYQLLAACGLALLFSASTLPVCVPVMVTVGIAGWRVRSRRTLIVSAAASFVAFATWYVVVGRFVTDQLHRYWRENYAPLESGFPHRAMRLAGLFFRSAGPSRFAVLFGLVFAAAAVAGVALLARRREWAILGMLTGPIVLSAVTAVASVAPFGGGRTDIPLYPCLALLVATAFDSIRRGVVPAAGVMCGALLLAAAGSWRDNYPQEDLRGAVAAARAETGDGTLVVTFPEYSYVWAFYGPDGANIRRDEASMTGFAPIEPDAGTLFLPGFQASGDGETSRELREQATTTVRRTVESTAVDDVWIVRSDLFRSDDLTEVDDMLVDLGFVEVDGFDHDLGVAEHWTCASPPD